MERQHFFAKIAIEVLARKAPQVAESSYANTLRRTGTARAYLVQAPECHG
jgi:hypothetical protein